MADVQDPGVSDAQPAGSEQAPPAASEQTGSAPVADSSGAPSQENANEPADDTGADEGQGEVKKPKSEFQKRIDRLTRQKGRAEREAARLAEELAQERSSRPAAPAQAAEGEPKLADYSDYESFQKALTAWTVKHTLKQEQEGRTAAERQRRNAQLEEQRRENFLESCESAREKYEDFDEVVFADENQMPKWAGGLIADADNSGEIAYFLAKNPKETRRIFSLHPSKAAIELGRLEEKLTAPAPKRISNAPPPASSPAGGGRATQKPLESLSADDFYARRTAQLRGKG